MAGILDHDSILAEQMDQVMETNGRSHVVTGMSTPTELNSSILDVPYLVSSASSNTSLHHHYHHRLGSTSIADTQSHSHSTGISGMGLSLGGATHVNPLKTSDSLRFEYPMEDSNDSTPKLNTKKTPPTVYREQDRFVPINNTGRVMRNSVPKNAKISKDAKQCMQECISEFISFLTSEASDRCIDEKRKTITGDDILYALSTLGFDSYVDPLQQYLKKYREFLHVDKPTARDGDQHDYQEEEHTSEEALLRRVEEEASIGVNTLQLLAGQLATNPPSSLPRL